MWTIRQNTVWKVSKYWVFSGPYFPVFSPNTGKYVPEKTPCLDTFHIVENYGLVTFTKEIHNGKVLDLLSEIFEISRFPEKLLTKKVQEL